MSIPMFLYLAAMADDLKYGFMTAGLFGALFGVLLFMERGRRLLKTVISFASTIALLIGIFTPSSSTVYAMAAGYGVEKVADNPDVRRLAGKSLELLEKTIDSQLNKAAKVP